MHKKQAILVIKLGALGDFVQAFGPMQAIRAHHPDASLTLLTTAPYEALGKASGLFDAIWIDPRPKWHQPRTWMALRSKFNAAQFTRVYDLQNNDRTALYFKLFSPAPEWVGAVKGASHANLSPERSQGHAFDGHIQTLALAGIHNIAPDPLTWMDSDLSAFDLPPRYALIVPGASPSRPHKKWPARFYAALCRRLYEQDNLTPVLIGGRHEIPVAQDIVAQCPQARNLCGLTAMTDIPALARAAVCAVGNDTGPMHLIGPTGCKTLVLFSADSNPLKHKPLGAQVHTIYEADLGDLAVDTVYTALQDRQFLTAS